MQESQPVKYVLILCLSPSLVISLCCVVFKLPMNVISSHLNSSIILTTFCIKIGETPFTSILIAVFGNFSNKWRSNGTFPSSSGFYLYTSVEK